METETTVRFGLEHLEAVRAATRVLQAEQRMLERYHCHSTQLALQIDDLEELIDRMSGVVGVNNVLAFADVANRLGGLTEKGAS